jgi:outer membrane protein TolC
MSDSKPEIAASRAVLTAREAERRLARAERWPSLSLVGGYSFGKPNRDVFNNDWDDYFSIGLVASWSFNLGNSTGRRSDAAGHRIEAARRELDKTVELLDREARLAGEALKLAYTQYQTASMQKRIAADNYRLATAKHDLGDLSTNRFLQVEESLTAADNALAAAVAEFYIARARFLFATGSDLLGKGD